MILEYIAHEIINKARPWRAEFFLHSWHADASAGLKALETHLDDHWTFQGCGLVVVETARLCDFAQSRTEEKMLNIYAFHYFNKKPIHFKMISEKLAIKDSDRERERETKQMQGLQKTPVSDEPDAFAFRQMMMALVDRGS